MTDTNAIETPDYFEDGITAIRLAKRLANIQAFVDAPEKIKQAAAQVLGNYAFTKK